MNLMFDGLPGVLYMMDDITVFGNSREEQDEGEDAKVKAVLKGLEENGVSLNFWKCEFLKFSVSYLGHVISAQSNYSDQAIWEIWQS